MLPGTSSKLDQLMSFTEGDTLAAGISFTITPIVEAELTSARIYFRTDKDAKRPSVKLSTDDANEMVISINTTTSWTITLVEQNIPLKAGSYVWQLETTDEDDRVLTYLEGTVEVHPDITR